MKIQGLAIVVFTLSISSLPLSAQPNFEVGTLTCQFSGNVGLLIGPVQQMTCAFSKSGGSQETYVATFSRLGLSPGLTNGDHMAWTVFASGTGLAAKALAGKYAGASKGIAATNGADALVGGSKRTIILQPLSVSGQASVSVALGAAKFRLR